LIIDDDMDLCTLLGKFLSRHGYETDMAHSGAKGIAKFSENKYDVVICDYRLGDMEGKDVLTSLKNSNPSVVVLMITGYSDIKTAVEVIKLGAFDYITKPLIPDEVLTVLNKALQQDKEPASSSAKEKAGAKAKATDKIYKNDEFLVGQAPATESLYDQINIVAATNYSIILYGECRTGNEVIAKTTHDLSNRKSQPFVAMGCGTLPT